jgi:putative ABC transport system substrate-binding protein
MASHIGRRTFLAALGGAAAARPLAARAQQPAKMPVIGVIGGGTPSTHGQLIAGFVQRLRELGWIEDRTVAIEIRWAEGRNERYTEIAAEFVRRKVDVILTAGAGVPAAKQATSVIPIVFSAANDPLGAGFVASLARPGGNITGLSMQNTDSASKRLELLREVVVGLRRLAILTNVSYGAAVAELREAHATARASGLEVITLEIQRSEDVAPAFEALNDPIGALYVCSDPLTLTNRIRINTLALSARLPMIYGLREYVEAGGLMSYGPNFLDLYRRSASYVDKILRGTKPADIPVEQPTKFDFIVNLLTAKALRLTIPPTLLARADEVIE